MSLEQLRVEYGPEEVEVLVLGSGYTGQRVARRLLARGYRVIATTRHPQNLTGLAGAGAGLYRLDLDDPATLEGLKKLASGPLLALHSLPTSPAEPELNVTPALLDALGPGLLRLVYISTTGVYGNAREVDHTTPVAPVTASQRQRVAVEGAIALSGVARSSLILRPAGIYGPGRGVHHSMQTGRYVLVGDGANYLSRIQVDDLAEHCVAGLLTPEVTGAYPVADEDPAPAIEVATFCSKLLGVPLPPAVPPEQAPETLRANRKVNGLAIRQALKVRLRFPSYRQGIPAALAEAAHE